MPVSEGSMAKIIKWSIVARIRPFVVAGLESCNAHVKIETILEINSHQDFSPIWQMIEHFQAVDDDRYLIDAAFALWLIKLFLFDSASGLETLMRLD